MTKFDASQYNEMGEKYAEYQHAFFLKKKDWTRDKLREELLKMRRGVVLDIGCGSGDDVKWCEENGIKIYGIEPSDKMCELAKSSVIDPNNIKKGSYEDIPFEDIFLT